MRRQASIEAKGDEPMKYKSVQGLFGQTIHYDENGNKVGESWPGLFGGENHYDQDGTFIGSSERGLIADRVHYDADHQRIGETYTGLFGSKEHYGQDGKIGSSWDGLTGTNTYLNQDLFGEDKGDKDPWDI